MESLETFQVFQDSSLSPDTTPNQMQVLLISLKSLSLISLWNLPFLFTLAPQIWLWPYYLHSTSYQLSAFGLPLFLCQASHHCQEPWNLIMPLPWLKSSTAAHSLTSRTILTVKEAPNTHTTWLQLTCPEPLLSLSPHPPPSSLLLPHFTVCSQLLYNSSVLFCFSLQASQAPKPLLP